MCLGLSFPKQDNNNAQYNARNRGDNRNGHNYACITSRSIGAIIAVTVFPHITSKLTPRPPIDSSVDKNATIILNTIVNKWE
jgi:hypothetical protein